MKKISILTTLMLFVLTVQAQEVIKGDANNDKAINLLDVLETSNAILGNPSENYNAKNADVNGDDQVNIVDIVGITNIIIINEQAAPTKADLIGTWEIPDEQDVSITFTESQITMTHRGTVTYEVPYTFENGILTYTTPPPFEGMEPYTETYSVSVLYDKSVLALKFTTVDEEEVVHLYKYGKEARHIQNQTRRQVVLLPQWQQVNSAARSVDRWRQGGVYHRCLVYTHGGHLYIQ